jgi:fatty-acyl-CoA synthase
MDLIERVKRDWILLQGVRRSYSAYGRIGKTWPETVGDDLERSVDKHGERPAFRFDNRTLTYAEFDRLTNRVARWARAQGLVKGDQVALFALNSPEYVAIWMGLAKIGVVTALVNTNLQSQPLAHSIAIAAPKAIIVDGDLAAQFASAAAAGAANVWALGGPIPGAGDLNAALAAESGERIAREDARGDLVGGDLCLLVYTSGTTGAPKAARMPHWRVQGMMRAFIGGAQPTPEDRNYLALPLYHSTGGLCGVGVMLERGGCVILRQRFSARHFWSDLRDEKATMFFYVGEMCRYLLNQAQEPAETEHKVRLIIGNGLRPDVWPRFQARFKLPRVLEFYGSTEGNVSMLNFDGHPGAIGRVPAWLRGKINVRLVKFDVEKEEPVRGADGLCIEADLGEAGEAIGEIRMNQPRYQFEGYSGDKAQTNKKILRDVFDKDDAWFRTGDLLRRDGDGYFYFVDRIGDTFRWKGENVSTNEVAERITAFPGVKEAIVYGVAVGSADGRAGMAAISADAGLDLAALYAHLKRELPAYARPLFIRLRGEIETTGTFKYRKIDLVNEGFDPEKTSDPLYFADPQAGGFVQVTLELRDKLNAGSVKV